MTNCTFSLSQACLTKLKKVLLQQSRNVHTGSCNSINQMYIQAHVDVECAEPVVVFVTIITLELKSCYTTSMLSELVKQKQTNKQTSFSS